MVDTPEKKVSGEQAPRKKTSKASVARKAAARAVRGTPWTFPKNPLEDAIRVAKAIEEKNAGNPMRADMLAKAVGFNQANDWRFLDLLRSANQFGLVSGTGSTATVALEKIGQDIVAPSSPQQRLEALREAFRKVEDFRKVDAFYGNKRIPESEYFANTLTRDFEIPRDRVDKFAEVYLASLRFLRSFSVPTGDEPSTPETGTLHPEDAAPRAGVSSKEARKREFLDTCFMMMPFGHWYDRYYQEIYVPAIKEGGLEPTRADELFTSGSVVEQIWEQIEKAKVLLADLTGKNPNVFYELGLAHAARKPVVFTSGNVEDVPFDLRHLRVIVYDVREPNWAARLQRAITDYLRNAIKDPSKSIPHPFRGTGDGNAA